MVFNYRKKVGMLFTSYSRMHMPSKTLAVKICSKQLGIIISKISKSDDWDISIGEDLIA